MVDTTAEGRMALVTGASSGLGVDFARELALRGYNLILVARRETRLREVREDLTSRFGVDVTIIPMDLASPDGPEALYDKVGHAPVDILVNNAGFAIYGEFIETPWEREKAMLDLDILAVVHLTKLFLQDMLDRDFGYILQIASIGAYQPSPTYATYSAAKSFVLHFGEALNYELRHTNVSCTVLSPGVTATEFLQVAGQEPNWFQRLTRMESPEVAKIGIESMFKRRPSVVPGAINTLLVWANRLFPRRLATAVSHRLMTIG